MRNKHLRHPAVLLAGICIFIVSACAPPPPPPPPPPTTAPPTTAPPTTSPPTTSPPVAPLSPICPTTTTNTSNYESDATLSPAEASTEAYTEASKVDVLRTSIGQIPLILEEEGPEHNTTTVVYVDSPSQAATIASDRAASGDLVGIEIDSPAKTFTDSRQPDQWALTMLHATSIWATTTGIGTTVAVIDTGVQADHSDLVGHVLPGHEFLDGGSIDRAGGLVDLNGHGTHVAGIIAAQENSNLIVGLSPGTSILPVQVLDSSGSGWTSDITKAIYWAVDNNADIINLSLGGTTYSAAQDAAVKYAEDHGVLVFAAAGNAGTCHDPSYPAAYDSVIAVAAVSSDGAWATYSSTGSYVDIAAPGSIILSTVPLLKNSLGVAYKSGTSMATPYAAASAALILAKNPDLTPAQVRSKLYSTANDISPAGKDSWTGYGLVDPLEATGG